MYHGLACNFIILCLYNGIQFISLFYFRWFDKSFHMALSKNAKMAINFEHSWGDGVAIVRFLNETIESSSQDEFLPSENNNSNLTVQELNFNLDGKIQNAIIDGK